MDAWMHGFLDAWILGWIHNNPKTINSLFVGTLKRMELIVKRQGA